jgi:hypothetical protein
MWSTLLDTFPSVRGIYLRRFGRKRFAFRTTTCTHFFALEAAKLIIAYIVTRDRLSAIKTEAVLTVTAIEESFAIKAESLFALFTVDTVFALSAECRLAHFAGSEVVAAVAEYLVALGTDEHLFIFALKTR